MLEPACTRTRTKYRCQVPRIALPGVVVLDDLTKHPLLGQVKLRDLMEETLAYPRLGKLVQELLLVSRRANPQSHEW